MAAKPPRYMAAGFTSRPLGGPGRPRRRAPRVRESDALPVTQAEREPAAPSARWRGGVAVVRESAARSLVICSRAAEPPVRMVRGTDGPAHSRKARSAFRTTTELVAGSAGNPRGAAARRYHRAQCARGARVERRVASFVSAGNRRCPACSQNAVRSADIAGLRPARGQHPQESGPITRAHRSLER